MNVLLSTIGRRSYLADYFRDAGASSVIGTTDRHGPDSEFTVGLLSCDRKYVVPSVDSPNYVSAITEVCQVERVDIICSMFDQDCQVLSRNLDTFRKLGIVPFLPAESASDICFDKIQTDRFLNEMGFGSPQTLTTINDFQAAQVGFPVVVKPRYGFASQNMFFVKDELELAGCFDPEVHIIQQCLEGQEFSFDILNDLEGKVISCVVKRKLKMRAGETDQAITIKNDKFLSLAVALGEALGRVGHAGPLDVDLFLTPKGVYILELNPRFGGGYPLAHAAGARFPELMIDIARGNHPRPLIGQYQENLVMMKDIRIITKSLESIMHIHEYFDLRQS